MTPQITTDGEDAILNGTARWRDATPTEMENLTHKGCGYPLKENGECMVCDHNPTA